MNAVNLYSDKVTEALMLATEAHKGQLYNGVPYIQHPIRVSEILLRQGYTEDKYLIVAYLHDVVEDTNVSLREIEERFGDEIADAVEAISRIKTNDYKESEDSYLLRVVSNKVASIVKFADMLDNLTMTGHVECPEHKQKLWAKYTHAINVIKLNQDSRR